MADNYDEYRQSKLEDAITKLTEISADLNKMIAVHELRLNQQEKTMDSFVDVLDKRREEYERKEFIFFIYRDLCILSRCSSTPTGLASG